jgi:integrase
MPRAYPHSVTIERQNVGYSLTRRANEKTYFVYFRGRDGRRLERDTNQTSMQRATTAAHAIIAEEYGEAPPETVGWDETLRRLREKARADGLRERTLGYYEQLVRLIRGGTTGPVDVTHTMADSWKKRFATTPTRLGELPSAHTLFNLIRGFRSLWQAWFIEELGVCAENPWAEVSQPKTDKLEVRSIDDETLTRFLAWIEKKYSGWELPRLFLETKAMTGCRLMDICVLESSQLRDGRLHFQADQTKGRKGRSVPLPPELYAKLEALKGPTYLWESYPAGLIDAVKKLGCPTHRIKTDFVPGRLYHWIQTLFLDYGKEHPEEPPIHSHMLRKRAFTAAWDAGIDPRRAAIAIGCNQQ